MSYLTGDAIEVGTVEQLLIDDHIVEDAWGLERRVCRPRRHAIGPVIHPDQPWEDSVGHEQHVFYDEREGIYRMLYGVVNEEAYQYHYVPGLAKHWDKAKHGSPYFVCYAESRDGLRWEKPLLDVHSWPGYRRTNIVMSGRTMAQSSEVLLNPNQNHASRKYVMMYRDICAWGQPNPTDVEQNRLPRIAQATNKDGRCLAYSPDCIHWTEDEANPITKGGSDGGIPICWNPMTKRWYCFCRPKVMVYDNDAAQLRIGGRRRRMALMTSPDLRQWTFPRTLLYPDELDVTPMCLDMWMVFRHGSHFVALQSILDQRKDGTAEVQIASSADGVHWTRLPHRPVFFERGPQGTFDAGAVVFNGKPLTVGNKWFLYYQGAPTGRMDHQNCNVRSIGVAVLPRGRLVGRFAGDREGFLLTRELVIGGKHLHINCQSVIDTVDPANREIRVGLAKRAYEPNDHNDRGYYKGFAINECDPIRSNNLALRVTWKGNDDLRSLVGKPAYLRFYLQNAGIYSFRFTNQ